MYLTNSEETKRELGERTHDEVNRFTGAVERELGQYELGPLAFAVAEVRFAPRTIVEYPKLFIHLRWRPAATSRELRVEASVPVRELGAMVRGDVANMNLALYDYVYMFTQKLLTALALTRRPRETTVTGRTPTEPELQNAPYSGEEEQS